jgi:lipopolysaccharide/colanic/teichoic acid biosynthesis glycosyltransferase
MPNLINVVRGEMALFGPPPVRRQFAARLSQLLAAYPHRFAIKPGIIGWSQANLQTASLNSPIPDESLRLSYDLYYAKQESPSLDLDIFLRTIFRIPVPVNPTADLRSEMTDVV